MLQRKGAVWIIVFSSGSQIIRFNPDVLMKNFFILQTDRDFIKLNGL